MVPIVHGPHCDADLRHNGCVCTDAMPTEEQAARITALAAEWADLIAKQQAAETDRLARRAFAE